MKISKEKVRSTLIQALKNNSECFAWELSGPRLIKVSFKFSRIDLHSGKIFLKIKNEHEKELFHQFVNGSAQLQCYIPNCGLIFNSEIKSISKNVEVVVAFPDYAEFQDRRQNERILQSNTKIFLLTPNQIVNGDVLEMSENGASALFSQLVSPFLRVGKDYKAEFKKESLTNELQVVLLRKEKLPPFYYKDIPFRSLRCSFSLKTI